jgi:sulfur carrier protein
MVIVTLEPENTSVTFPKINSVLQLLNRLQRKSTGVLVIRNGKLLTPDCKILHNDNIIVRDVTSRG